MYTTSSHKVNIRRIKEFALAGLPKDCALRDVILTEDEELGVEEFLPKMDIWLKLSRNTTSHR